MNWIEFKIECKENDIDYIEGILIDFEIESIVVEDPRDLDFILEAEVNYLPIADSVTEKVKSGRGSISFYLDEDVNVKSIIDKIEIRIKELGDYEVKVQNIKEEDWANNWKKYYKRLNIGQRIVINPMWEEYEGDDEEIVVNLDPGMAFGTGTHETTILAAELIEKYSNDMDSLIDVGTGSGILAIIAAKLGVGKVFAVDIDERAVSSTQINAASNNVNDIEIVCGNLLEMTDRNADMVVANIVANVLLMLNKDIHKHINEGGIYILSGIYYERLEEVKESLKEFEIIEIVEMGEWRAIACRR